MKRRDFLKNLISTTGLASASSAFSSLALAEAAEARMAAGMIQPSPTPSDMDQPRGPAKRERWTPKAPAMPAAPRLADFFEKGRFGKSAAHCLQSAKRALGHGAPEEIAFACLIHDLALSLLHPDHGWWGAQLFAPYVSERVAWAVLHHQPLRFFPDPAVGYEYPKVYIDLFGENYVPEPYLQEAYKAARNHKWYGYARAITVNDDYSFQEGVTVKLEPFTDIIGRHFKQPREGLGFDGSPTAHMWRTLIDPTRPL